MPEPMPCCRAGVVRLPPPQVRRAQLLVSLSELRPWPNGLAVRTLRSRRTPSLRPIQREPAPVPAADFTTRVETERRGDGGRPFVRLAKSRRS